MTLVGRCGTRRLPLGERIHPTLASDGAPELFYFSPLLIGRVRVPRLHAGSCRAGEEQSVAAEVLGATVAVAAASVWVAVVAGAGTAARELASSVVGAWIVAEEGSAAWAGQDERTAGSGRADSQGALVAA